MGMPWSDWGIYRKGVQFYLAMVVSLVLDSHFSTFYEQLCERERYGKFSIFGEKSYLPSKS